MCMYVGASSGASTHRPVVRHTSPDHRRKPGEPWKRKRLPQEQRKGGVVGNHPVGRAEYRYVAWQIIVLGMSRFFSVVGGGH